MKETNRQRTPRAPVLGVGDSLGAGDSYLVADMLPPDLVDVVFGRLKTEVQWQTMYHRGRDFSNSIGNMMDEDAHVRIYRRRGTKTCGS